MVKLQRFLRVVWRQRIDRERQGGQGMFHGISSLGYWSAAKGAGADSMK
jgi:hypothetical protein